MPFIDATWNGAAARKQAADTSSLGANMPEVAALVERVELVVSSFKDPGDDWGEFRAYDKDGKLIATRHTQGY